MSNPEPGTRKQHSLRFFARERDGSVRLRLRFQQDEASLFEEAAGDTPVMVWINRTLTEAAKRQVRAARQKRTPIPPPQ